MPLHLFDTFAGLLAPDPEEHGRMREGNYAASLPAVRAFLSNRCHIGFHRGLLSAAAAQPVSDRCFTFVHLDVDLKSSTLEALDFFYRRMVAGGIILLHGYSCLDRVRAAFTEFLADKRESAIELPTSQAMIVRLD